MIKKYWDRLLMGGVIFILLIQYASSQGREHAMEEQLKIYRRAACLNPDVLAQVAKDEPVPEIFSETKPELWDQAVQNMIDDCRNERPLKM